MSKVVKSHARALTTDPLSLPGSKALSSGHLHFICELLMLEAMQKIKSCIKVLPEALSENVIYRRLFPSFVMSKKTATATATATSTTATSATIFAASIILTSTSYATTTE